MCSLKKDLISGLHVVLVAGSIFLLARCIALRMPVAMVSPNTAVAASACLLGAGLYVALARFAMPMKFHLPDHRPVWFRLDIS